MYDRFELTLYPPQSECPPERLAYRRIHIVINGRPLIELVRAAEEPWARAEYLERLPEFENPEEFEFSPGAYHYLTVSAVSLQRGELLDRPRAPGFVLDADDPRRGKATVLGCTCGIVECWFLQVRIDVKPDAVVWSEFGQFHHPHWKYDLGPFTFDRRQYESQLTQAIEQLTGAGSE